MSCIRPCSLPKAKTQFQRIFIGLKKNPHKENLSKQERSAWSHWIWNNNYFLKRKLKISCLQHEAKIENSLQFFPRSGAQRVIFIRSCSFLWKRVWLTYEQREKERTTKNDVICNSESCHFRAFVSVVVVVADFAGSFCNESILSKKRWSLIPF